MSLNIKDEETHRLAQQLARLTGENMTKAVSQAVRERLEPGSGQIEERHGGETDEDRARERPSLEETIRSDRGIVVRRKGTPEGAQMIVDSSTIIAILRNEPDAAAMADALQEAPIRRISAVTYVEAAVVADNDRNPVLSRRFDDFMREAEIVVETVTLEQAKIAREAYRDFSKGRHRAGLNFGDCFAYALAKVTGEPLLF